MAHMYSSRLRKSVQRTQPRALHANAQSLTSPPSLKAVISGTLYLGFNPVAQLNTDQVAPRSARNKGRLARMNTGP
jgi:hypothetical protein